ncbi:hypothetical protein MASR2M64_04320 [Candidatus Cloacimonadota bacterium]
MWEMCESMSKQCYLLVILLLGVWGLKAEVQLQSGFYSVSGNEKQTYLNQSLLDADFSLIPNLTLSVISKLDAADRKVQEFPQKKWMNNSIGLQYRKEHWDAEVGYRNLLFGSPDRLQLYPEWRPGTDFDRQTQHQAQLGIKGNFAGLSVSAYGINKQLRCNPVEYVYDFGADTMIPTVMPEQSFGDVYYGVELSYAVKPFLSINASTDMKQANFTGAPDIYKLNTFTLGTQMELQPISSSRFSGTFNWRNCDGRGIPDITRNIFETTLRYQQSLGLQFSGFISLINDSCSDDKLNEVYLLSNQVRCHLLYHFEYDPAQASYISAGVKHSLKEEAIAIFGEGQWKLVDHVYGTLGYRRIGTTINNYQVKVSYNFRSFTECYLQCNINDSTLSTKPLNYLGIGTSIRM